MAKRNRRSESRSRYFTREEANRRGWDMNHVSRGGDCVEENEVVATFSDIGLGQDRPDFLLSLAGRPAVVIETKNNASQSDIAIQEAVGYANQINASGRYDVRIAVGVAGQDDTGYVITSRFLHTQQWTPLQSYGAELTNIPTRREAELAVEAGDGTTTVTVPSQAEFIDSAIEVSRLLRLAKVEAPLRPKVIGALVLAMYEGDVDHDPRNSLVSINTLVKTAVAAARDLKPKRKGELVDALTLSRADFNRLSPSVGLLKGILRRLNVRAVMQTDADFLGMFYEAFLRYGYDNTALGIVFTPAISPDSASI